MTAWTNYKKLNTHDMQVNLNSVSQSAQFFDSTELLPFDSQSEERWNSQILLERCNDTIW